MQCAWCVAFLTVCALVLRVVRGRKSVECKNSEVGRWSRRGGGFFGCCAFAACSLPCLLALIHSADGLPCTCFLCGARMVPRIPGTLRGLSTSAKVHLQHVLYFGDVLGYNSVQRFAKLPRAWIDAVGASADIDHGVAFTHAAGSPTHSMLSYTLLDTALNPGPRRQATLDPTTSAAAEEAVEEGEVIGEEPRRRIAQSKVFALGRNTHAQLGLGFASQEATRGMVTGDIAGKGGITHVAAGTGFSFVVAADEGESNVYGFGNDTLGQLGSCTQMEERRTDAYDVSTRLEGRMRRSCGYFHCPNESHSMGGASAALPPVSTTPSS